ncbi:MAG: hypothetical protein HY259_00055 [Chloroflexi bacterium]|nr:hypothetical protein [Chloroflexota bacterium]MBI3731847.1 hypothetical protein [Chloroflexota bacterium]
MPTFPEPTEAMRFDEAMASLPPDYPDDTLAEQIRIAIQTSKRKVVVLDDDPTGPQAMGDVFVLTEWTVDALRRELAEPRPLFFVLTNTRALPVQRAIDLHVELMHSLNQAARQAGKEFSIVSRADSTLRGHFPDELGALGSFDAVLLVPFFLEGGRYTLYNIQWVREGPWLLPAAQTPYARDPVFGYSHSHLANWIEEKSRGRMSAAETLSLSLDMLRKQGPDSVARLIAQAGGRVVIANAMSYRDLEVIARGVVAAESEGYRVLVRSAASFVRVRGAAAVNLVLTSLGTLNKPETVGALVIVGSHVPRSSAQLERLLQTGVCSSAEVSLEAIVAGDTDREIAHTASYVNRELREGRHVVVYTSRRLIGAGGADGFNIGQRVATALVEIVRRLTVRPRFIVAKGGWTASEIGTKALGVRRAYVPAPVLPGVPVWLLGNESRFPGLPFVIFPGNVGDPDALVSVVNSQLL